MKILHFFLYVWIIFALLDQYFMILSSGRLPVTVLRIWFRIQMGQRMPIGNPDQDPDRPQRKEKMKKFHVREFSAGLEVSPGA